jgi:hypothetical protein
MARDAIPTQAVVTAYARLRSLALFFVAASLGFIAAAAWDALVR